MAMDTFFSVPANGMCMLFFYLFVFFFSLCIIGVYKMWCECISVQNECDWHGSGCIMKMEI